MKPLLSTVLVGVLLLNSLPCRALMDGYYATGEDLDYLIDSDQMSTFLELEFKLRRFVLFRNIEDYIFELSDQLDLTDDN